MTAEPICRGTVPSAPARTPRLPGENSTPLYRLAFVGVVIPDMVAKEKALNGVMQNME